MIWHLRFCTASSDENLQKNSTFFYLRYLCKKRFPTELTDDLDYEKYYIINGPA